MSSTLLRPEITQLQGNKILIAYSPRLGSQKLFLSKIEKLLESFTDFLIIALNDSRGFIRSSYQDHLMDDLKSNSVSEVEAIDLVNLATHFIIFWDGLDFNNIIYHALKTHKPIKIIPVETTKVVNRDRDEEFDIYIGRKTIWGNPYLMTKNVSREQSIGMYKQYFYETILKDENKKKALLALKGKRLGCHCKPFDCHGDVIAEYLNTLDIEEN